MMSSSLLFLTFCLQNLASVGGNSLTNEQPTLYLRASHQDEETNNFQGQEQQHRSMRGGRASEQQQGNSPPQQASLSSSSSSSLSWCPRQSSLPLGSSNKRTMGRIGMTFLPSSCRYPNMYPGVIGTEERYYEQVGPFAHPMGDEGCVTVRVHPGSCMWENHKLVYAAAYTSFNQNLVSSGYLGGVGHPDEFDTFQFHLPQDTSFHVVGHQILPINYEWPQGYIGDAPNGNDCEFSVEVDFGGDDCSPDSDPLPPEDPAPELPDTYLEACTEYTSNPMGSSGRTVRGIVRDYDDASTCVDLNVFPGTTTNGRAQQYFEEIGPFVNLSDKMQCAEVTVGQCVTSDSNANPLVHVSAYLDSFDPLEQGENYLGSVGNLQAHTSFHFRMPPQRAFTVVGRQVSGGDNSENCQFTVTASITDDCPP